MKVPFHLARTSSTDETLALYVPGEDTAGVLVLATRFASFPRVHRVTGGYFLRLASPTRESFPGAVRLRALADALYLPVDAALVPTLLDDEARDLARDRGLVFLPGARVLAFDPRTPLAPRELLDAGVPRRQAWEPFAAPEPLASDIARIVLELPDDTAQGVIERGGAGIGERPPAPPEPTGAASDVAGRMKLGMGRLLRGLGKALGSEGLAGKGADMIRGAVEGAPSLAPDVLGHQEAALRELLRKFQAGEIDEALRRALPLGGTGTDKGARVAGGAQLPTHDTRYSLGNVLGARGQGASVWFGGQDVQRLLADEYRKAALEAIKKGDHRRAAFIYAKLLRDYRTAAHVLQAAGLSHDAAILYLEVGDTLAAARAFESAGEFDRAIEIYENRGEHMEAGELYRRLGDEERAVEEFRLAAAKLAQGGMHLRASEILLEKAKRRDLAIETLEAGWNQRPMPVAVGCALRLPALYVAEEKPDRVLGLVTQAEELFSRGGHEATALDFWNGLADLAATKGLESHAPEIRDRARLGLARKLRERAGRDARAGDAAANFFRPRVWAPAVVMDSGFAFGDAVRKRRPVLPSALPSVTRVPLGSGTVTAVAWARRTGEVFVGFERGEVFAFRPIECEVIRVCTSGAPVIDLACTPEGDQLVILRAPGAETLAPTLESCVRAPFAAYRLEEKRAMESGRGSVDEPALGRAMIEHEPGEGVVAVSDGYGFELCKGPRLIPRGQVGLEMPTAQFVAFELVGTRGRPSLLLFDGAGVSRVVLGVPSNPARRPHVPLGWRPAPAGSLQAPVLSVIDVARDVVEIAAVTENGAIAWTLLDTAEDKLVALATRSSYAQEGYQAVALLASGKLAGVTPSAVSWLRAREDELGLWATTEARIGRAVAAFPSERTHELLVVTSDGTIVRVPAPE